MLKRKAVQDPQSLTDSFTLLDQTISVFKAKYKIFLTLSIIPACVGTIISYSQKTPNAGAFWLLLLNLVNLVLTVAASVAIMHELKESLTVREALNKSKAQIIPYFLLVLAVTLIMIGGFILLIVPGIVFLVWFVFAPYILIFENKSIVDSLKQSREYVKGYWFAVFGKQVFLFVALILFYVVLALFSSLISLFKIHLGFFIDLAGSTLVMPAGIIYMYFVYKNLKEIKQKT